MAVQTRVEYCYIERITKLQRNREVRDLYKKLMRDYRSHRVYGFFDVEYKIGPNLVNHIVMKTDKEPVVKELCSSIYKAAMRPGYKLI